MSQFYGSAAFDEDRFRLVKISAVNLNPDSTDFLTAIGRDVREGQAEITLKRTAGGQLTIPEVGEMWLIERSWTEWVLAYRTDWQNPAFTSSMKPGQIRIPSPYVSFAKEYPEVTLSSGVTGEIEVVGLSTGQFYINGDVAIAGESVVDLTINGNWVTLATFGDTDRLQVSEGDKYFTASATVTGGSPAIEITQVSLERITPTLTYIIARRVNNRALSTLTFNMSYFVNQD